MVPALIMFLSGCTNGRPVTMAEFKVVEKKCEPGGGAHSVMRRASGEQDRFGVIVGICRDGSKIEFPATMNPYVDPTAIPDDASKDTPVAKCASSADTCSGDDGTSSVKNKL